MSTTFNKFIQDEISRLTELHGISAVALEDFAQFVIANHKKKTPKPATSKKIKPLTSTQLKQAIYKHFNVQSTPELKKSSSFKMATDGMGNLNFSAKETLEKLYREFIGVLPGEEVQEGYGCINGINIFDYFKPWQIFGLDPQTSSSEDIKKAYYELSKKYHPDIPETGDAKIFDRINVMYRSITAEA